MTIFPYRFVLSDGTVIMPDEITRLEIHLHDKKKLCGAYILDYERIKTACIEQNFAIEQALGRALGYVEPDGTVNVCEHTAETLAIEAARELAVRDRAMEILAECHNPVYCPFPEDEHTPCVKCTFKQYSKNYQKFQVDAALAQARAEMEGKLEAKP